MFGWFKTQTLTLNERELDRLLYAVEMTGTDRKHETREDSIILDALAIKIAKADTKLYKRKKRLVFYKAAIKKRIAKTLLPFMCLLISIPAFGQEAYVRPTPNFVSADQSLAQTAELRRKWSAIYWTGKELDGDWTKACPIKRGATTPAAVTGGGMTHFVIDRGEIFGFDMSVQGTDVQVHKSVLPHEVDHIVRATVTRRYMPRMWDEGAAMHIEDVASKKFILKMARDNLKKPVPAWMYETHDYPKNSAQLGTLYSVSMVFVDYLVSLNGPEYFMKFLKADGTIPTKLKSFYNLGTTGLQTAAVVWQTKKGWDAPFEPVVRVLQETENLVVGRPVLHIWSTTWCPPCKLFKAAYADKAFRRNLNDKVTTIFHDPDLDPQGAKLVGVSTIPTFILVNRVGGAEIGRWSGFDTPANFMGSLSTKLRGVPQEPVGALEPKDEVTPTLAAETPQKAPERLSEVVAAIEVPIKPESDPKLDMGGLTLIILTEGKIGHISPATWEALFKRLVEEGEHHIQIEVVAESDDPVAYAAIKEKAGVIAEGLVVLAMIPKTNQGFIKGLLIKRIERKLALKRDQVPVVDVFFERTQGSSDYEEVLSIAKGSELTGLTVVSWWETARSYNFWMIVALISERLMNYGSLGWLAVRARKLAKSKLTEEELKKVETK